MTKEEIDILLDVINVYENMVALLGCESKLDATMIGDTLLRLKSGEYKIVTSEGYRY